MSSVSAPENVTAPANVTVLRRPITLKSISKPETNRLSLKWGKLEKLNLDAEAGGGCLVGEEQVKPQLVHHHPVLHGHQILCLTQHQISRLNDIEST